MEENKIEISGYRVKQYNSKWKRVVTVNGKPIAIVSSQKQESDIVCYLTGFEVDISDGRLKKELDKVRKKMKSKKGN